MAQLKTFRDLVVWQRSQELVLLVYSISADFPKHEMFGVTSQIRRAVVSVAANIVEGFRRNTIKDSLNFYNTADASLEEVKYFLILSRDLKYLSQSNFDKTMLLAEQVGKLLTGWIQSQRKFL